MATALPKGEKRFAEHKRAVVMVSIELGYLLDLVSRYQCMTKKALHAQIWRAGLLSYLGVDPDQINTCSPLPRGTAVPKDAKQLVEALLGA